MLTAAPEEELAEPLVREPEALLEMADPVCEALERVDEPVAEEEPLAELEVLTPAVPLV